MPNLCSYELKAVGTKENQQKLLETMKADYKIDKNDPIHMWRIFDADEYRDDTISDNEMIISGNCAWSVHSCMFDGDGTYQKDDETGKGTTIVALSKELDLIIEIFSEECGYGFMEHFLIDKGELKINDCIDYNEYSNEYETYEEFIEEEMDGDSTIVSKEQFEQAKNDDEYIKVGGIDWEFTI